MDSQVFRGAETLAAVDVIVVSFVISFWFVDGAKIRIEMILDYTGVLMAGRQTTNVQACYI